jgi:hypothetical protein
MRRLLVGPIMQIEKPPLVNGAIHSQFESHALPETGAIGWNMLKFFDFTCLLQLQVFS